MRTWPAPSILPSMVRSAAISDSLAGASAAARGGAAWVGLKSAAAGVSRIGVGVWAAWGFGAASLLANDGTSFLAELCWLKLAMEQLPRTRSEESRVGKECVSMYRLWGSTQHSQKYNRLNEIYDS